MNVHIKISDLFFLKQSLTKTLKDSFTKNMIHYFFGDYKSQNF